MLSPATAVIAAQEQSSVSLTPAAATVLASAPNDASRCREVASEAATPAQPAAPISAAPSASRTLATLRLAHGLEYTMTHVRAADVVQVPPPLGKLPSDASTAQRRSGPPSTPTASARQALVPLHVQIDPAHLVGRAVGLRVGRMDPTSPWLRAAGVHVHDVLLSVSAAPPDTTSSSMAGNAVTSTKGTRMCVAPLVLAQQVCTDVLPRGAGNLGTSVRGSGDTILHTSAGVDLGSCTDASAAAYVQLRAWDESAWRQDISAAIDAAQKNRQPHVYLTLARPRLAGALANLTALPDAVVQCGSDSSAHSDMKDTGVGAPRGDTEAEAEEENIDKAHAACAPNDRCNTAAVSTSSCVLAPGSINGLGCEAGAFEAGARLTPVGPHASAWHAYRVSGSMELDPAVEGWAALYETLRCGQDAPTLGSRHHAPVLPPASTHRPNPAAMTLKQRTGQSGKPVTDRNKKTGAGSASATAAAPFSPAAACLASQSVSAGLHSTPTKSAESVLTPPVTPAALRTAPDASVSTPANAALQKRAPLMHVMYLAWSDAAAAASAYALASVPTAAACTTGEEAVQNSLPSNVTTAERGVALGALQTPSSKRILPLVRLGAACMLPADMQPITRKDVLIAALRAESKAAKLPGTNPTTHAVISVPSMPLVGTPARSFSGGDSVLSGDAKKSAVPLPPTMLKICLRNLTSITLRRLCFAAGLSQGGDKLSLMTRLYSYLVDDVSNAVITHSNTLLLTGKVVSTPLSSDEERGRMEVDAADSAGSINGASVAVVSSTSTSALPAPGMALITAVNDEVLAGLASTEAAGNQNPIVILPEASVLEPLLVNYFYSSTMDVDSIGLPVLLQTGTPQAGGSFTSQSGGGSGMVSPSAEGADTTASAIGARLTRGRKPSSKLLEASGWETSAAREAETPVSVA
ncbi:MAG: hypothetical protein EOO41_01035, partial [Methanobacteriota archaeon]